MNVERTRLNRRAFLRASACAISAPLAMPSAIFGFNGGVSPSNKINVFHVGMGVRGNQVMEIFLDNPNYRVVGTCDCMRNRAESGAAKADAHYGDKGTAISYYYEEALERPDVDVICCACPDHWHTKISVEACRAGKDVYCEKPLTLTLQESRLIVKAARKYNRVCTGGSQRVMEDYGSIAPILQSGAIGEVKEALVEVGGPPIPCYLPEQPIPEGLDWDRWLGQAPYAPYNEGRYTGFYDSGWRRYSEYGTGFLADWGAHKFAAALYCVGLDLEEPVEITPPGYDGSPYAIATYKNGFKIYHIWNGPDDHDMTFKGTEGEFDVRYSKLKPLKQVDVRRYAGGATTIADDFAFCVRHRARPFQDFAYAAKAAALCQLFAICHKLGRKLQWDAENCRFVGDEEANRHVARPQRAPYAIPSV